MASRTQGSSETGWLGADQRSFDPRQIKRGRLLIRVLKVGLPLVTILAIALTVFWPELTKKSKVKVEFSGVDKTQDHLVMMNPRFTGVDERNRDFYIVADTARQDQKGSDLLWLDRMQVEVTTRQGDWYTLFSKLGIYDQTRKFLEVQGGFSIYTDAGYEVHGDTGTADLKNTIVVSNRPVRGQGKEGQIYANAFHTEQQGERLFFKNGVRAILYR